MLSKAELKRVISAVPEPEDDNVGKWVVAVARAVEAAVRDQMLEADLTKLTERGAVAWLGFDAQDLRDGGKP